MPVDLKIDIEAPILRRRKSLRYQVCYILYAYPCTEIPSSAVLWYGILWSMYVEGRLGASTLSRVCCVLNLFSF